MQPSQVKVRVIDATGTNVGASVVEALADQGFQATQAKDASATIAVTEIRYGYGQAEEAKALLPVLPRRQARPRSRGEGRGQLALGHVVPGGTIFVPPTTTTDRARAPRSPRAPVADRPRPCRGRPSDPCSQ